MAGFKFYRVINNTTTAPTSFVTGTTATSTALSTTYLDKGVEVTFQNQSTSSVNIFVGGSDMQVTAIGATSTLGATVGILLGQNGAYTIGKRHSPSAINMSEWYMISTSTNAICTVQLIKAV